MSGTLPATAALVVGLTAFAGAAAATVTPPDSDTLTVTLSCG